MRPSRAYRLTAEWLLAGDSPAPPPRDCRWEAIIAVASHHYVTPGLAWQLRHAAWVPPAAADYLDATLLLNRHRNAQLRAGLARLCERLSDAGLRPLLLKGAGLLASDLLPDPGYRLLGDLDILLEDAASLDAAATLLTADGYVWGTSEHSHQLPAATHPEHGFTVELHHSPARAPFGEQLDKRELFARAETVRIGETEALIPCAADRLAIALVHGQLQDGRHQRGIPSLRMIGDIALHLAAPDGQAAFAEACARLDRVAPRTSDAVVAIVDPYAGFPAQVTHALDSPWRHWWLGAKGLARALPGFLTRAPQERRLALTGARWRSRLARNFARW